MCQGLPIECTAVCGLPEFSVASHSHRTAIYINITTTIYVHIKSCIIVHTIIQTSWKLVSLVLHTLVDISSGVAIHCWQPLCTVDPSLNPPRALDARLRIGMKMCLLALLFVASFSGSHAPEREHHIRVPEEPGNEASSLRMLE